MALLKTLVIGMGIMIVGAMALLAYGLITKTSSKNEAIEPATVSTAAPASFAMPPLGDIVIPNAQDCRIVESAQHGATLRVTLDGTPACRRLVLIDLTTGEIAAQVRLSTSP